ncbi:MAG: hemerythrin domain-containing protein [Anaerolineales bacterium]|nr:hemerythrin domain-containing protein [Anaerolineales bacterium]
MKITDALLGEHAVFYAQFDHLEQAIPAANSIAQVKSLGAMLAAALASHAQMEEELLFTTLEPHIGSMGPLAVMRTEHDEIEKSLERLPMLREVDQVRELLLKVVTVAREHFPKEEQVLYPMANKTLSAETLIDLGAQWAARRAITLV